MRLNDLEIEVIQKDIKNVHLSVYPPNGRVKVAAPETMSLEIIRAFVISKLAWIKKQQQKFRAQERESPREYLERESHYFWGKRYLLKVVEQNAVPMVRLNHSAIVLQVKPNTDASKRGRILEDWYRAQLKAALLPLFQDWEAKIGVTATRVIVQKMKTQWGSCTPASGIIRINLELVKKPRDCLEYIIVHELVHLLEPSHNRRFSALMNHYLPKWKSLREELNRLPVRHEIWDY
ncbi:M48 family metallopeptidase [Beggiatoa leptomitoformis]|uniref:DUF45 domain-containing protein n=1 Tax=Beggiatoa leptomitoformis TaxID=288004 RepID=A0A2N9YC35_9GAMM|nr:SprT family zinc-dependent metalloprotease [Beggiatoa leptomitoformis]ALG66636.1 DUF45 domain-containing protein [Beggiatoa leptomitoformis]AUI68047.1 DUF45 domain-containing protein [Beggiatoa leptomitoformis]